METITSDPGCQPVVVFRFSFAAIVELLMFPLGPLSISGEVESHDFGSFWTFGVMTRIGSCSNKLVSDERFS